MSDREDATITCTLAPAAMAVRLADIARLTARHLRAHRVEGRTLHLAYAPAAAAEVARIVALERACCAFLDFEVEAGQDACTLRITAPTREGTDARWLFEPFLPGGGEASDRCACKRG
jgi:hypothetical protein